MHGHRVPSSPAQGFHIGLNNWTDLHMAVPLLERAIIICQEADLSIFFPDMAPALGAAYTLAGRVADAVALLMQAMEQTIAMDMRGLQALCSLPLGEAQMLGGRLEDAHALAERTLILARAHQERGNEAYALRLLGEIAARRDPPAVEQAEVHYQQALILAEALGMRPLMAPCSFGLGTLYARIGRPEQARIALSTAVELYHTMGMTFWLSQVEAAADAALTSSEFLMLESQLYGIVTCFMTWDKTRLVVRQPLIGKIVSYRVPSAYRHGRS